MSLRNGTAPFCSLAVSFLRTSWFTAFTVIYTVFSAALVKSYSTTVWPIWANPLDRKPVGCQREIDNITFTPLPSRHHPSADLRLHGQHLSLVVCLPLHTAAGKPIGESARMVKPGPRVTMSQCSRHLRHPHYQDPVACAVHHITNWPLEKVSCRNKRRAYIASVLTLLAASYVRLYNLYFETFSLFLLWHDGKTEVSIMLHF